MGAAISNPHPHPHPHDSPRNLHHSPSPGPGLKPSRDPNQVGAALSARSTLGRTIRDDLFGGSGRSASLPTGADGAGAGTGARRSVRRAGGPRMTSSGSASILVGRDERGALERGWEESSGNSGGSGGSGWAAAAAAALQQHGYCVLQSRDGDGVPPILIQTATATATATATPTPTATATPTPTATATPTPTRRAPHSGSRVPRRGGSGGSEARATAPMRRPAGDPALRRLPFR